MISYGVWNVNCKSLLFNIDGLHTKHINGQKDQRADAESQQGTLDRSGGSEDAPETRTRLSAQSRGLLVPKRSHHNPEAKYILMATIRSI